MPTIQIEVDAKDYDRLHEEYRKNMLAALQSDAESTAIPFEQWLLQRLQAMVSTPSDRDLQPLRAYGAVEKLVFALHQHGFGMVELKKSPSAKFEEALRELAVTIADDLQLSAPYAKRVHDLLNHFSRSAKAAADEAHIGVTAHARAAMTEAYRLLNLRTEKALDSLGSERAIGRIEGAAAVLVSLDVMDRDTAKGQTDAFKIRVRSNGR